MDWCLLVLFMDAATTEIYTLSLHDALPILSDRIPMLLVEQNTVIALRHCTRAAVMVGGRIVLEGAAEEDRKSTRLNSSHLGISYAVFCLKKKIDKTIVVIEEYTEEVLYDIS